MLIAHTITIHVVAMLSIKPKDFRSFFIDKTWYKSIVEYRHGSRIFYERTSWGGDDP